MIWGGKLFNISPSPPPSFPVSLFLLINRVQCILRVFMHHSQHICNITRPSLPILCREPTPSLSQGACTCETQLQLSSRFCCEGVRKTYFPLFSCLLLHVRQTWLMHLFISMHPHTPTTPHTMQEATHHHVRPTRGGAGLRKAAQHPEAGRRASSLEAALGTLCRPNHATFKGRSSASLSGRCSC